MLKAQVLLGRAGFSVGAIDGVAGENASRAISAFEETHGLTPDGRLGADTWRALTRDSPPILIDYEITPKDVAGPFLKTLPDSIEQLSKLDRLAYTSPLEALAEKFHMSRALLQQLNRGTNFGKAGTHITVANVLDKPKPAAKAARVEVDKSREAVTAFDANGQMVAYYPASVGSRSLPSPTGLRKVRAVATNPKYYYRPDSGVPGPKQNLVIAAGPNNPVGEVWIDLDAPGYGIHGTPEPEDIGKTFSHGCVRLTNWDAQELATLVTPGTPVEFVTVVARSSKAAR